MKKALVVGGGSGIGLGIVHSLLSQNYDHIYIIGKDCPKEADILPIMASLFFEKTSFIKLDLTKDDLGIFDSIKDIDTLVYTAGFGRVTAFENLSNVEISNLISCNLTAAIQIIGKYYDKIKADDNFYCAVMGSIAGHVCSPLFSVYGAAKAGLCNFIESINAELAAEGYSNRILDVSPGSIKGTNFNGNGNNLESIIPLANEIVRKMMARDTLYIPGYDSIYSGVIDRYRANPIEFGISSYNHKRSNNRVNDRSPIVVGYLSGTFDLFHIGHLNLLRRAKEQCDYLIVGVHKSGAWKGKATFIPFEERVEIVKNIRYVDEVIESFSEDSDAYDALHFNKLFVGSDYKGSERFAKYEAYFVTFSIFVHYPLF